MRCRHASCWIVRDGWSVNCLCVLLLLLQEMEEKLFSLRSYRKYIQRIEEMERMLRFLSREVESVGSMPLYKNRVDNFLQHDNELSLDTLEADLNKLYDRFVRFQSNNEILTAELNSAIEELHVVRASLAEGVSSTGRSALEARLLDTTVDGSSYAKAHGMQFSNIAGVISVRDQETFARTVFRATRGNAFTHFTEIAAEDLRHQCEPKSVFVIYFQGDAAISAMAAKLNRICRAMGVNLYDWPESQSEAEQRSRALESSIADKTSALQGFDRIMRNEARSLLEPIRIGGNSRVEEWRLFCMKEKSIYATLNLFEGVTTLRADCWYPANEEDAIRRVLAHASFGGAARASAMLVTDADYHGKPPPTYVKRDAFTDAFQELVETYGVPHYKEFNPGVITIVTFPFMFGVMYGDVAHGAMLLCVAIYALLNAERWKYSDSAIHQGLSYARYLLFGMGFFAIYAGFMYNDFLSVGMGFFGDSRYEDPHHIGKSVNYEMQPKPWFDTLNTGEGSGPYPFGIDPSWHGATNELLFMNSLKMKLSVLFGVVQMLLGVCLKFSNSVYHRNWTDFIFECIPQLAFMVCFFGYMDWMIMYKWVTPVTQDPQLNGPPSLINTLIGMGLSQPNSQPLYQQQADIQKVLMYITACAVPIMLIPKPIIIFIKRKMSKKPHRPTETNGNLEEPLLEHHKEHSDEHDEEPFGEVVIHQIIETIEYVLGTISHTASYLRQWALSLAHQQLSLVFFQKTLQPMLETSGTFQPIWIYVGFAVLFGITVGVLLFMDVLECFLHTLRLHWVEFQSKFYKADGYSFVPYRHQQVLIAELNG
ncbi:H(+)-transporting V0 sector ATPase subunit a [Perkinsus chesapeaki]|uniref:V-type proton ATPase subunit a n=1 Tax=Perkinsus chesapeaki TaxID=330153 RepID=A0A7J6LQ56_PERCH|nr:H(+)-transporting V0 sector ATPase subunit a [Perkinsus chesapeaki]